MTERYDLHIHSNISDGTQPLTELVPLIHQAGLSGFALTDHDTARGWEQAAKLAEHYGLDFLPGAEFSCRYEYQDHKGRAHKKSVHLLAYGYNRHTSELSNRVEAIRAARTERVQQIVKRLTEDYPLTWAQVQQQVGAENDAVGRPHIADALVAAGVATSREEAFRNILHPGSKYYIRQESMGVIEAVQLVRAAGGVPVVAHPMSENRGLPLPMQALEEMADAGLAGVEVYHRENSQQNRQRLLEFTRARGLLITGSSDYHGAGKPNQLGENTTDAQTVHAIREQIRN